MAGTASFLIEAFRRRYPEPEAVRVFRAPGRVNLIGEHTDYNLGLVLPMALDKACYTATGQAGDGRLRVFSREMNEERQWPVADIANLAPARDWSDYVAGVALELARAGYEIRPQCIYISSTVPVGSGLSSSAALEVSVALALLGGRAMEPLELARLCRRAETGFVGLPCGIMDQYVSVFGRENAAIRIDCRSLEHQVAGLPRGVEILAVNSMVKHDLGASAYRQRVAECASAVAALRQRYPETESLRDASLVQLETVAAALPEATVRRARHVITEGARVDAFIEACRRSDLLTMGRLFVASHRSLQRDYEVSCEELDFLVETALGVPGVLGARMTGGGFGGCTVNLVRPEAVEAFETGIVEAYRARFHIEPRIYRCRAAAGAGEVLLSATSR